MFLSIFLFFTALAVAGLVYYPRARIFDEVTTDTEILAHWTYDPAWYARIVEREYHEHKERNFALLIIIDGMFLVFAIIFIAFVEDGGLVTGIILIGIAVLLYIVAKITPGYFRRLKEKVPPEVWISRKGLVYEGSVYPYSGFLYGCNGVHFQDKPEKTLNFSFYQVTGGRIYDPFTITVPVPENENVKAKEIAEILNFYVINEIPF